MKPRKSKLQWKTSLARRIANDPPAPDEIEVSIFGPGKGEAIAVHLGNSQWITVDSCRDQSTKQNPTLEYFSRIGVEVARDVRLVVGTHAHDDHIAGISEIFAAARDAQFVTSTALTSTEFYASVVADADIESQLRQSVRAEYRKVILEARDRGKFPDGRRPILKALEQKELWSRSADRDVPYSRVVALSPSDEAIDRSMELLRQGSARVDSRRRLSVGDPNEYAVALWIEIGDVSVLLGADLITGPKDCGWNAVLTSHSPATKASMHKVPHHGSINAHHPDVWSELLDSEVISLMAPFRAGRTMLPTQSDIERVASRSSETYLTAKPGVPTATDSVRKTKAALSGIATDVREPYGQVGHVRARHNAGGWTVETFAPAYAIA